MTWTRQGTGAVLAPLAAAAIWASPLPLAQDAHRLAAIFVAVIVLWVTEAIPIAVTALLIGPAVVMAGVCGAKEAFAPYADPLLYVFVGGFMLARSMTRHGLDRRVALSLVHAPGIAGRPARVRAAFVVAGMLLSMWISNTATTAMLVPIVLGLATQGAPADADRRLTGSLLAVAYCCSVGGLGTPVGSPPNLIAMRFLAEAGIEFSFFDWVKVGLPTALAVTGALFAILQRMHPAGDAEPVETNRADPGEWTRGERITALAFTLAALGWMAPGLLNALDSPLAPTVRRLFPAGVVALVAASILFALRDERRRPVLPWEDAARIDWGVIILFGGGISLGRQMLDTGLAAEMSRQFVEMSGVSDVWTLTAVVTVFTVFFTEACSNVATSNMLVPLVLAMCSELQISPVPPVLGVGLAASCAFMLPVATGPNALVYGTGVVSQATMMRAGALLNAVAALVVYAVLRILCPLYGWV